MAVIREKDICVLIPAYNEADRIGPVLESLKALGCQVLVVDDGSTDDTVSVAKGFSVDVLVSNSNHGKGASLRKGFDWFLQKDYPFLVMMDADGQHDTADLGKFVDLLDKRVADFVVGNRMNDPQGMPRLRRGTNRLMSWIISFIAGQRIPDTQCGYRALRREVLERLSLRTSRYEIESEMLLEASRLGFRIGSVSVRSVYEGNKSAIHPCRDTLRFIKFLFSYIFSRK